MYCICVLFCYRLCKIVFFTILVVSGNVDATTHEKPRKPLRDIQNVKVVPDYVDMFDKGEWEKLQDHLKLNLENVKTDNSFHTPIQNKKLEAYPTAVSASPAEKLMVFSINENGELVPENTPLADKFLDLQWSPEVHPEELEVSY